MCSECGGDDFITDNDSGDLICRLDGAVVCSSMINEEQTEYRLFQNDSQSWQKKRLGPSYNIYNPATNSPFVKQEVPLSQKSSFHYNPQLFLQDAIKDIHEVFSKLYLGGCTNKSACQRAVYLFTLVYQHQLKQKSIRHKEHRRVKFSRRKQFVVMCIYRALWNQHESDTKHDKKPLPLMWNPRDISNLLQGIDVSMSSIQRCLKDVDVYLKREQLFLSKPK